MPRDRGFAERHLLNIRTVQAKWRGHRSASMPANIKPLTAMRFFAALWVVAFHYTPSLGLGMPALIGKGYLGVELFFVLSGFILSHVYMASHGEGRFNYAQFLWARLARIYPVHIATLLGLGALIAAASLAGLEAGDHVVVWASIPAQLTLTQAWGLGPQGGWNHPSWSISAEWFAYLAFPAFAALFWRLRDRPRLAAVLAALIVLGLNVGFEWVAGFPLTKATILWGAMRIVPCFALGCAVWLLWRADVIQQRRFAVSGLAVSLAAIVGAALLGAPDWFTVWLFGALILCLASLTTTGSRLLTGPVWVYLGEVSFAVYMVCIPWELVFSKAAQRLAPTAGETLAWPLWALMFVGVVPAAMIVHHLVERPARDIMRRHGVPFSRRRGVLVERTAQISAAPR
jgi:peptidoglycan/LPS O-acetylase OafA/YrhL